jgi:putative MATE family efflux protein
MKSSEKLGKNKIIHLLLEFSVPSIIGMLVNALYNVVDRIYVGQGVGTEAMSALTIVFPFQLIIFGFVMLIGVGGASLISISLGKKNRDRAEHIVGNGFTLLVIVGITASLLGLIFLKQIVMIAGASEKNFSLAYEYMRIILYFIIFQFIGYGLNSFIRSEGNPIRSMFSMLVGAIVNIILDPIFIFGFKMGVKGAAIATGISLIVAAVWNFYYFTKGKSALKLRVKHLMPNIKIALPILKIGFVSFFLQIVASGFNIILNNQIKRYSGDMITLSQAAIGVAQGFNMIFFMPILGINMGAQPIIGFNYGAKNYDRVKKAFLYSLAGASILTISCFLICQFFPGFIFKIFNSKDIELMNFGSNIIRLIMLSFPIVGIYVVSTNYFQSIGKAKHATLLGLSRPLVFLIPAVMIMPIYFGLSGIWLAMPLADIFSTLLTVFFIIIEFKRLNKKHLENSN